MTEEMIKEIRDLSKKYIDTLDNIKRQKGAKENFEKALREKVEEDFLNKKLFLRYNAELTGLTLEFRNIYGIEGGLYEEKLYLDNSMDKNSPFIYPKGTATKDMYDSHLLVKACGSMSSLGQTELPDDSPFYVDALRTQEGSPYYIPFCPINLSSWCGNKYYKGYTKKFYKTEHIMVNFIDSLNNSSTTTFTETGKLSTAFDYRNGVEFYSDKTGSIKKEIYKINVDPNSIPSAPGGGYYASSGLPTLISGEVGYLDQTGILTENKIISFRLVGPMGIGVNGINSSEIGYAYVYKRSGSTVYLDLFHYNGDLLSKATTYTRRKLWKFWDKITYTNPQTFYFSFCENLVKDNTVLDNALNTYESIYIDNVLHYLNRIQMPDENTKASIEKMNTVKEAFSQYRKGQISRTALINKIKERRNWVYKNPNGSINTEGKSSIRAQQIHDHLRNSDIFEKTYGTLNNRINKRTGTLRELIKYSFNTSVANSITDLKKESLTSYGDTLVVYPLTKDTDGTNEIEISLEEDETIESFYEYIKWMSEIYVVSDNAKLPFFKTRVMDIAERGESALAITLAEPIPEDVIYSSDDNARLVRVF